MSPHGSASFNFYFAFLFYEFSTTSLVKKVSLAKTGLKWYYLIRKGPDKAKSRVIGRRKAAGLTMIARRLSCRRRDFGMFGLFCWCKKEVLQ